MLMIGLVAAFTRKLPVALVVVTGLWIAAMLLRIALDASEHQNVRYELAGTLLSYGLTIVLATVVWFGADWRRKRRARNMLSDRQS